MKTNTRILLPLLLLCASNANAQKQREYTPSPVKGPAWNAPSNMNPFIPGYFADPTIRQFGDTYYLYATTDGTGNGYGPAQVWASKDFVNWTNYVMNWPTTEVVWAPDVVQQPNGKYRYFYCEPCNINIGESDTPAGPWTNILGQEDAVMVPDRYIHNVITLDPMLFEDEDKSQYLYFTTWGIYNGFGCGVAKLKDGDFSLSNLSSEVKRDARRWNENSPFPIAADSFFSEKRLIPNTELKDIFEAPFIFKRNGVYYFTYSSGSCHTDTYRVQYATSTVGPMGPFEYKGEILTTNADETVHGPGHHSVIEKGGKYYIVYHRHNNPKSIHGFNRQVCIDQLNFDANGNILPVTPTHNAMGVDIFRQPSRNANLAFGAKVTASSYYDDWFKPEYAVDDNNATLWKARHTNWDNHSLKKHEEWIELDLGKEKKFNEIWTQFEYATFFYQYKIETSSDHNTWTLYADRTDNTMQGSPMIDRKSTKARYVRLTITDTQKNGHMPAVWNIKVWAKAPQLPSMPAASNDAYPGMHKKDVDPIVRQESSVFINMNMMARNANAPFDVTEMKSSFGRMKSGNDASKDIKGIVFHANKPIRARVKDGKWAMFFNGTQYLESNVSLPETFRYNSPYTISAWVLSTKVGPVSTVASLSSSRADLATTQFRLGTDPATGLVNHNGSFESSGAPAVMAEGKGKWQFWVVTYDGWMERAYCNGQLVKEKNNFLMIRPQGKIIIGADGDKTNNFVGYIHSLSISPASMDSEEIKRIYDLTNKADKQSLGDDDFEEIDPDSKFVLPSSMIPVLEKKEPFRLSASAAAFNDAPFDNGAFVYKELSSDFVVMAHLDDMEGLRQHNITGFNEGGIIIEDNGTFYQLGAFPLYNCGNMLTVLSGRGRPQYPNYKGYDFDRTMQFERRGNKLYARTSNDGGKTWNNMPGSPLTIKGKTLKIGAYQTTYSEKSSWAQMSGYVIYAPKTK